MKKLILLGLLSIGLTGCAQQQVAAIREAMDQSTASIRAEHLQWTHDKGAKGELTPEEVKARETAHQAYQDLVNKSRSQDGKLF